MLLCIASVVHECGMHPNQKVILDHCRHNASGHYSFASLPQGPHEGAVPCVRGQPNLTSSPRFLLVFLNSTLRLGWSVAHFLNPKY